MTATRRCPSCQKTIGGDASFCRHCGAPLAGIEPFAAAGGSPDGSVASEPPAPDEKRLLRELGWLCVLPVAISVVYAISVRVLGVSALGDLVAGGAVSAVALGGALSNRRLVADAFRLPAARDAVMTLLVALVVAPALSLGFWSLEHLGFTFYSGYLTPYLNDGWPRWVGYLSVAGLTPLSEETLFRGLIQPKLAQIISPNEALIVQAALFSAVHLSPVILVTHFAMGLAFGWLRKRSGSLFPGILLHGAWNAWVIWSGPLGG